MKHSALDRQTKVMLVGEARTYYVLSPCEYATVFNHHPLADAARRDPDPQAILQWLKKQGVVCVLVDWSEIRRLRSTYGFDPELNEGLFDRLVGAGLKIVLSFRIADNQPPEATLYEVPQHE